MIKKGSVLTAMILLFNSCYSYKSLESPSTDFIAGEKYEIRIGDREMQRVLVKEVSDEAIVVEHNKAEMTVQKSMITESKQQTFSTGKTVLASAVGLAALISVVTVISLSSGD